MLSHGESIAPGSSTGPLERFGRHVVVPVSAFVIGAIVIVLAFVLFTAVRQNTIALDASTRLAETALKVKQREIARNLKDYAVWEAAYENLHVQLNREWAATDGNVGANILNSLGYDMAFVVAPDGRTVYAVIDGEPGRPQAAVDLLGDRLRPMLREAAKNPEPVVGLLPSGANLAMVAATSILPPPGLAEPPAPENRSILIFAKNLSATFLDKIGKEYLLGGLTLLEPGRQSKGAALSLTTAMSADEFTAAQANWRSSLRSVPAA